MQWRASRSRKSQAKTQSKCQLGQHEYEGGGCPEVTMDRIQANTESKCQNGQHKYKGRGCPEMTMDRM